MLFVKIYKLIGGVNFEKEDFKHCISSMFASVGSADGCV